MNLATFSINQLLGLEVSPQHLTFVQMACRSVIVFVFGIVIVRFADRRFLGRNAGFDVLLGVVLGSVLSRGINGQAAFLPTLGASAFLVVLHRCLGTLACRYHGLSRWLKGKPHVLIRDGAADESEIRRNKISGDDLEENLRLYGNVRRIEDVAEARLERNGEISVVRKE